MNRDVTSKEILQLYKRYGRIKPVAESLRVSWNRVVKTLSANEIIVNSRHEKILELYKQGKSKEDIAKILNCSVKTVEAYIPRKRPPYFEDRSENAIKISKCREKKYNCDDCTKI